MLAASGCETLGGWREREEMQKREDMLIVQDDIRKLQGRLEGIELEVERMSQQVATMRDTQSREVAAQLRSLQDRLTEIESRIARVDAAREKDKQEMIDRLSGKIAEIMARAAPKPSGKKASERRYSGTGYEHEVKSGESISAIAAAYGVSVQAILDNNDIKDAHKIRVGQKLFIPE